MATKGNYSKEVIVGFLLKAFAGNAFLKDKKVYINIKEGADTVQVCVALTCPKTPLTDTPIRANASLEEIEPIGYSTEFTDEEIAEIKALLARLEEK